MREIRQPKFGDLNAVTALTLSTKLAEVDILVAARTRRGRELEAHVQYRRTCGRRRRTIGCDVALAARHRRVLSREEVRKARVLVAGHGEARGRVARFACRAELALVDVSVTTDARDLQASKISHTCCCPRGRHRRRLVASSAGKRGVFADEWECRPRVIERRVRKAILRMTRLAILFECAPMHVNVAGGASVGSRFDVHRALLVA